MAETVSTTSAEKSEHEDHEKTRNLSGAERCISVIGGGALTIYGVSEVALGGAVLAGIGGYLLYRGTTGYCPLYARLGVSSREPRPMRWSLESSAEVHAPAEALHRWFREPEGLTHVTKYLREVRRTGDRGFEVRFELPMGKVMEGAAEIAEEQPERLIKWRLREKEGLEYSAEVHFTPSTDDPEATEIRFIARGESPARRVRGAMTKLAEVARQATASLLVKSELERLKRHIEAPAEQRGEVEGRPRPMLEEAPVPSLH